MQYRGISADGHINEPPTLWVDNLPDKFKERGPRVIETPNTKGHAWIMEGQSRPAVMGFSSMYFKSSKKFDRASIVESFKNIKDRGVRYDDLFPGSYDAAERVKEMIEGETDAEVIFNGVGTVWNGIKLCPDKELALACYKVYNDWMADFQAYDPERLVCNATLPTTGIDDCIEELQRVADLGLRTVQLEGYPSGDFASPSPVDDRFWAAAVEIGMPINVHQQFFFPVGDLGSKLTAEGVPDREKRPRASRSTRRGRVHGDPVQHDLVGRVRALPGPEVHRHRELRRLGPVLPRALRRVGAAQPPRTGTCRSCRASTSTATSSVVYIFDELGLAKRYDVGVKNIMWGPDFPHSTSSWPVDYQIGLEALQRVGATPSEIERIMWRNAAEMYKLPFDEPATAATAA